MKRVAHELRLVRLFIRDWWDEFPVAWSLARMRDCERRGGHPWGDAGEDDVLKCYGRTCQRCGTFESVRRTEGTVSTTTWVDATNATHGREVSL